MTERKSYLLVVVVLLLLSLVASVVLFRFLDSFAEIKNKSISLGGSIAGFVAIFYMLRDTYFKIGGGKKIEEQFELRIPQGYKSEISKDFQFGFSYPEDWEFSRYPQLTVYGFIADLNTGHSMNVTIEDISRNRADIEEILESSLNATLIIPNTELVFREKTIFSNLHAMKQRIDSVNVEGEPKAIYQISVVDKDKRNLFVMTFGGASLEDFDNSRILFDNIASTFRIG